MSKTYVTFGQSHIHKWGDKIFDKDCVAVIECKSATQGRSMAFDFFDKKFCFEYHENEWDKADMKYYPRGYIAVNFED